MNAMGRGPVILHLMVMLWSGLKDTCTILFIASFLICGCTDLIEYSPYDTPVKTCDLNKIEAAAITSVALSPSDTFRFALFSDIHKNYDDMSDALGSINNQSGLQFVACCGDITHHGLAKEFEWYLDVVEKSKYPFITAIGNHDYLSNGCYIFEKLFGPPDMSFVSGTYKFILFSDILAENDYKSPRYDWLINELSDTVHSNIIFTHIPPYSIEPEGIHSLLFSQIVTPENTILCLHGHSHSFSEILYNGIHTLVSADINDREYYIISLIDNKSIVKRIEF